MLAALIQGARERVLLQHETDPTPGIWCRQPHSQISSGELAGGARNGPASSHQGGGCGAETTVGPVAGIEPTTSALQGERSAN